MASPKVYVVTIDTELKLAEEYKKIQSGETTEQEYRDQMFKLFTAITELQAQTTELQAQTMELQAQTVELQAQATTSEATATEFRTQTAIKFEELELQIWRTSTRNVIKQIARHTIKRNRKNPEFQIVAPMVQRPKNCHTLWKSKDSKAHMVGIQAVYKCAGKLYDDIKALNDTKYENVTKISREEFVECLTTVTLAQRDSMNDLASKGYAEPWMLTDRYLRIKFAFTGPDTSLHKANSTFTWLNAEKVKNSYNVLNLGRRHESLSQVFHRIRGVLCKGGSDQRLFAAMLELLIQFTKSSDGPSELPKSSLDPLEIESLSSAMFNQTSLSSFQKTCMAVSGLENQHSQNPRIGEEHTLNQIITLDNPGNNKIVDEKVEGEKAENHSEEGKKQRNRRGKTKNKKKKQNTESTEREREPRVG